MTKIRISVLHPSRRRKKRASSGRTGFVHDQTSVVRAEEARFLRRLEA
jgi:hypothetical protein